jgi:DNA-binding winged helix-turn-helix (wHTH) protein
MNSEPAKQRLFIFGEYEFDADDKILRRGDSTVSLAPKSGELLTFFLENAGRLLTKSELLEKVWAETFVEESNLTHHVAVLRKALGEDANGRKFIETLPRKGYRFVAPVVPRDKFEIVFKEKTRRVTIEEIETTDDFLIGRERELAVVKNLLRRADTTVLTLTGVGGAGKTVLARRVMRELTNEFSDGAFFVDLSGVRNDTLVAEIVAEKLSVRIPPAKDQTENLRKNSQGNSIGAVAKFLRKAEILLVLDNFEQVIEAAPTIGEIAANCGASKILVTSRARLNIRCEREFAVPPLEIPITQKLPEELIECSAVRLFVERGRAARPEFELTDENARGSGNLPPSRRLAACR